MAALEASWYWYLFRERFVDVSLFRAYWKLITGQWLDVVECFALHGGNCRAMTEDGYEIDMCCAVNFRRGLYRTIAVDADGKMFRNGDEVLRLEHEGRVITYVGDQIPTRRLSFVTEFKTFEERSQ